MVDWHYETKGALHIDELDALLADLPSEDARHKIRDSHLALAQRVWDLEEQLFEAEQGEDL